MCKKLLFLISFVLVLVLAGSASAADKFDYRVCWWSDLGPGHDWNEPNNWWTMDRYWDDDNDNNDIDTLERKFYVKEPNQVPDVNTAVFVGKGEPRIDYPEYLHFNPPPFEPTISSGTAAVASGVWVGGGYSQDPNDDEWPALDEDDPNHWDPCMYHELTVNGGTLDIGTPQTWEGYDTQYDSDPYGYMQSMGYFNGIFGGSCLKIGTVGWIASLLGPGIGQGTMNMNGGTVNVGGHMEVGAWEENLGTLNMTNGVINITQGLYCPSAWDGTGRVNLSGGIINARYIFMNDTIRTTGLIDIAGGKFILSRGNEVEELTDYSNGIGTLGVGEVLLTAYGVGDGDIITDDVNYPDALGKRADLSIDYDVSNEGKTTVQAFLTDPNQAWNPSPPNGAGNVKGTVANIERPVLSWSPGDGATSHEVYFDANEALVSARDVSVRKQTTYDPCSWTVDSDLTSFATYYWAIDENPGPTLGQVWSFTMADLTKAGPPSPEDGATDVHPAVDLSWGAGIYAVTHDVYFSTDFNDVNDRLIDPCNTGATNSYDPPGNGLEFSTTYYWRVDECNSGGLPLWPGDLWSFTTSDHITVDNFELYVDIDTLNDTWHDWATTSSGTGQYNAEVIYETTTVHGGSSSMLYRYNNNVQGGGSRERFSESWADASALGAGTNWTVAGVEALQLYFYGSPDNTADPVYDRMWVGLEDGSGTFAMVHCDDMNDVGEPSWHEWNIILQDFNDNNVDLTDVNKMYIGFGVRASQTENGTDGAVIFDDIELWPIRCVPAESLAADFTGDCVVDEQDLDIMAAEWLARDASVVATAPSDVNLVARWEFEGDYTDSNGTNHGDPYGEVTWVSDPCRGNVLSCDGDGDYVEIPGSNTPGGVFDIRNAITLSAWIKLSVVDNSWPAIIASGDDDWGWRIARSGTKDEVLEFCAAGISGGALEPYGNVVGSVPVVDDQWHHAAGVYDGSKVCVYIDGIVDNCEDGSGPIATSSAHVRIGSNEDARTTAWTGYIDDVRVYNCALQPGEIAVLAGLQGSIYVPLSIPANLVNLVPKVPLGAPFDPNNLDIVNFLDYGKLAEHWLKESPFPPRP